MGGRRDCYNGRWGTTFRALHWRSMDSCGLACVSLSAGIHLFAFCTIANRFLSHSIVGIVLFLVAYIPSTVMALWSLYMAWSTDPGAVPMGARPLYHPRYSKVHRSARFIYMYRIFNDLIRFSFSSFFFIKINNEFTIAMSSPFSHFHLPRTSNQVDR